MFLRISRVRRNGKTYEYAQLVESYRRSSDGMPVQRTVASLGTLSAAEIENLQAALEASRQGRNVVVASAPAPLTTKAPKPLANLRYLDTAVLLSLWRELGLDELLAKVLPQQGAEARPADVIAALTIQRCCDAGSKLFATRWFPRTALPELTGIAPRTFNNTRLHRELEALESAGPALMAGLPHLHLRRDGAFNALFVDATDTWFEGSSAPLAKVGLTKEGLFKRKIGIALMCSEQGYPLRWEVFEGSRPDCRSLGDLMRSAQQVSWIGEAPVVLDRAMGKTAQLRELHDTGLRFLTALSRSEFSSYSQEVPHQAFATLEPVEATSERDIREARRLAAASGLARVDDDLFVLDLGVVERAEPKASAWPETGEDHLGALLRLSHELRDAVRDGRHRSFAAAGRELGLRKAVAHKYLRLNQLSDAIQNQILAGRAAGHTLVALLKIAALPAADQGQAFERLLATPARARSRTKARPAREPDELPVRVRAVAYFNPALFVEQRIRARSHIDGVLAFAEELNQRLASPRSRHTSESLAAAIDRKLRGLDLLTVFRVEILELAESGEGPPLQVRLTLNEDVWALRRRYDGFSILAGHPDLTQEAYELCLLYRAKDAVEKDFQVIKGLLQLRPVRHRTDAKIRAHVSICMLALTLERHLGNRLADTGYTARAALELLQSCHLNQYEARSGSSAYTVTRTDQEQNAILEALRLQDLAQDDILIDRITPR